jgi:hypothetical protein
MSGKGAFLLVIGLSIILGYILLNLDRLATTTVGNMSKYNKATASHNLATSGANVAVAKLYADTSWRGTITQSLSGSIFTGSFTASVLDLGPSTLMIRSVSSYPMSFLTTIRDTVDVYFEKRKKNSFSMFAWMTDFEGNVFWVTGDTVWGRVHSNGNLHVNGRPVFMEKATTSKRFDPKPGTGVNRAIFKQGYETGVATIDFPNDLSELISAADQATGRTYPPGSWVTLYPGTSANNDGYAIVRSSQFGPVIDSVYLNGSGFNGAMWSDGRINVQGTLDGRLTIGSGTDVYIQNDIVYERNPRFTTSDDILGLVAENNVVVADNVPNGTNCEIHASIFSRKNKFTAENYNSGPVRGELRVLGSIVQQTRGEVGQFSGSNLMHGYWKRYRFDTRLSDPAVRPPYYPGYYTKTFAITNWWESYRTLEFE